MIPRSAYTVNQRAAASSSTQCLVAPAASTGRVLSSRPDSKQTRHTDCVRPKGAAAVELHPLHADVAAYYADYAGTSPVLTKLQAPQQQHVVEVHLEVHYKACFGSQLAVVGSHTGWLTSAAVPMTCGGAEADIWSVVLSLPYGSDVEYKYVVINQQGGVVRWQEGANNTLCLRGSGLLMHVSDSWAHESRQVNEIGVPVPSQQQQRQRAAGGSSSLLQTPAAASPVLLQNNIACFTPSSSSSSASAAAPSAEAADSSIPSLQQQQQALLPGIKRSSSFDPPSELDTLSQDVARLLPLLQLELASALASLSSSSSSSSSSSQQDSAKLLESSQQQAGMV
ncbi:hypothetical protein COO60DRAFT_847812 [Scenedesmus sp. NREL 46B-D3]|nr:hypothetical protein COO60DRAFT_847812 [Scenedesmus sp. NREL 46B-D3]